MEIKVKKLWSDVFLPRFAHEGDAGMDLFANGDYVISPGERVIIGTGIAMQIPKGYVGLIWDKSGIAKKYGLKVMGGVIDSIYRGEISIIVCNLDIVDNYYISKGDKVAQLLIQKVESPTLVEVDELTETDRGSGGFGSTGK